jgi:hypothetical protein
MSITVKRKKSSEVKTKQRLVPGTNVPYQNWIQAWIVSNQAKRKKKHKI